MNKLLIKSDPLTKRPNCIRKLACSNDFTLVFNQTDLKVIGKDFIFLCRKTNHDHFGYGLVVQKKKVKKAVDRNYIKRLIRSTLSSDGSAPLCWDIVVLVRDTSDIRRAQQNRKVLHRSLVMTWRKFKKRVGV